MIWIFPMAGKGERTKTLGDFKPFIRIGERMVIEWFLLSVSKSIKEGDELIFVTTSHYASKFDVERSLGNVLVSVGLKNKWGLLTAQVDTQGSACTVKLALDTISTQDSCVVANCDQIIDFEMPHMLQGDTCYVAVYSEFSNKSGYMSINDGLICEIREKENHSNLASAGVFIFPSAECLSRAIKEMIMQRETINGEYYLSMTINHVLSDGYKVVPIGVLAKYDLGNIGDIEVFKRSPFYRFANQNQKELS